MKTVEHRWRISLAAAFLTTVWTATTPAAELPNTAAWFCGSSSSNARPHTAGHNRSSHALKTGSHENGTPKARLKFVPSSV